MEKITKQLINEELLKYGYYAEDPIIYRVLLGLLKINRTYINPAQDIYALCLDGPPGAGKTEYGKVYTKILKSIYGEDNVSFIGYQCDPTTGKTELYEDLNIIATVVDKDREKIIIPGAISQTIQKVNEGKKVVLFLDEYDKAREETDSFLLQFLQDGKINTTQYGLLEIKEEYKNNLQVLLCKNDVRKDLSNQFYRRVHMLRLDYMKPELFYQVAMRSMIEKREKTSANISISEELVSLFEAFPKDAVPVHQEVINLVSIMYQAAYQERELYMKLPAASEMLIAIEETNDLMQYSDASQNVVHHTLLHNLFKYADDVTTFESQVEQSKDKKLDDLRTILGAMKEDTPFQEGDLNRAIADQIFHDEASLYHEKIEKVNGLLTEYEKRFEQLEKTKKAKLEQEASIVTIGDNQFTGVQKQLQTMPIFHDESAYIKRGLSVFSLDSDWCDVATMYLPDSLRYQLAEQLTKKPGDFEVIAYEDGYLLSKESNHYLAMVLDKDSNEQTRFRFLSNQVIPPASVLKEINKVSQLAASIPVSKVPLAKDIQEKMRKQSDISIQIDTLVYNENPMIERPEVSKVTNYNDLYSVQIGLTKGVYESEPTVLDEIVPTIQCDDSSRYIDLLDLIQSQEKGKVMEKVRCENNGN